MINPVPPAELVFRVFSVRSGSPVSALRHHRVVMTWLQRVALSLHNTTTLWELPVISAPVRYNLDILFFIFPEGETSAFRNSVLFDHPR